MTVWPAARIAVVALIAFALRLAAQAPDPPSRGPAEAGTQIEAFLSFEGTASARMSVVLDTVFDTHPGRVRIVFRHVVDATDAAAALPHRAAIAAGAQGRFWEMAGLMFANQDRLTRTDVIAMATQLKLDVGRFAAQLDDPAVDAVFEADRSRATAAGVTSAPALIVNGTTIAGVRTARDLDALIAPAP